jgi:8-oxo-dGTP pyrophosphatase MutT (NUDIX family)
VSRPGASTRHPLIDRLAAALAERPGRAATFEGTPARAAVAVVFRVGADGAPELLLILRAEREGDPWSGHVALPGGRRQPEDATLQDTAVRETLEETSVDLGAHGAVLGTLDELHPRTPTLPPIVVTPFVFTVAPDVEPTANEEVAEAFWVPWSALVDPAVSRDSTVRVRGAEWRVPSYVLGRHVVWGMTERILRNLTSLLA